MPRRRSPGGPEEAPPLRTRQGRAELGNGGAVTAPRRRPSGRREEPPTMRSLRSGRCTLRMPGRVGTGDHRRSPVNKQSASPNAPIWPQRHPQRSLQCSPTARRPPVRALGWVKAGRTAGLASGLVRALTEEGRVGRVIQGRRLGEGVRNPALSHFWDSKGWL